MEKTTIPNSYQQARNLYWNTEVGTHVIVEEADVPKWLDNVRNSLYKICNRNSNQRIFRTRLRQEGGMEVWRIL